MTGALLVSVLAVAGLLVAVRPRLPVAGPGFTSLFQGSTRQNTYIGLAVAGTLYGAAGLSAAALAVMPAVAALACLAFGAAGVAAAVAVLFCGLPAATSAYILARQLGGDAALMARIITLQVAVSAVSLPVVLLLLT